ncbi:DUF6953 family protein [Lelliottia amnigena]|uniref:DUF6953 family protein n=1 Tax=Lelliottia amnigena TaxID=61646 RepID=UPI003F551657
MSALTVADVTKWMLSTLQKDGCLYQQDVVDYLVKFGNEQHLRENADGNQALSTKVINRFRVDSGEDIVWVRTEMYWRYRVQEDEQGRDARG